MPSANPRTPLSLGKALRATTILLILTSAGCSSLGRNSEPRTRDVASLLTGHFTSAAQAKADPEFFVFHLHMTPIWTDRADGPWLYVEQAMATALDKPYRQRIYRLVDRSDGAGSPKVESQVFELPNAA
ncbi:MAG: chromophore lyase CpcT/CpeT, partial [bacterium]